MAKPKPDNIAAALGCGLLGLVLFLIALLPLVLDSFKRNRQSGIEPYPADYVLPAVATVHGKIVDASGNGVSASVSLKRYGKPFYDEYGEYENKPLPWVERERSAFATTDPDGSYRLQLRPWVEDRYIVTAYGSEITTLDANLGITPGATIDMGTVLVESADVDGTLVDRNGEPIAPQASAQIWITRTPPIDRFDRLHQKQTHRSVAIADGSFGYRGIAPGTYAVDSNHVFLAPNQRITVAPGKNTVRIQGTPESRVQTISGRVLNQRGFGAAGYRVYAHGRNGTASNVTDHTGEFSIRAPNGTPTEGPVSLALRGPDGRWTTWPKPVTWSTPNLELRVDASSEVSFLVVRASDSTPIRHCTITLWPGRDGHRDPRSWSRWRSPGRYPVDQLAKGPHRVHIQPHPKAGLAAANIEINAPVKTSPIVVHLPALVRQEIILRHADGTPAIDAELQWIDRSPNPTVTRADQQGRATLAGPANTRLQLRCSGSFPTTTVVIEQLTKEATTIEVPRGAQLELRQGEGTQPHVFLVGVTEAGESQRVPPEPDQSVTFGKDGIATIRGIPAGTWMLAVRSPGGETRVVQSGLRLTEGRHEGHRTRVAALRCATIGASAKPQRGEQHEGNRVRSGFRRCASQRISGRPGLRRRRGQQGRHGLHGHARSGCRGPRRFDSVGPGRSVHGVYADREGAEDSGQRQHLHGSPAHRLDYPTAASDDPRGSMATLSAGERGQCGGAGHLPAVHAWQAPCAVRRTGSRGQPLRQRSDPRLQPRDANRFARASGRGRARGRQHLACRTESSHIPHFGQV